MGEIQVRWGIGISSKALTPSWEVEMTRNLEAEEDVEYEMSLWFQFQYWLNRALPPIIFILAVLAVLFVLGMSMLGMIPWDGEPSNTILIGRF